ncbi:MAG: hypothetical protein SGJ11_13665 [Phycisphaerae bacterium]|nr:hypothetical protein [Phycisphaerae bacterium]
MLTAARDGVSFEFIAIAVCAGAIGPRILSLLAPMVSPTGAAAVVSGERFVIVHARDGASIPFGDGRRLRVRRFWAWLAIHVVGEPLGAIICLGTPATTRALAAHIAAQSTTSA